MEKQVKRIGLMTSHASMNFGGLLQAYALKETIKKLGYECEMVNYKPEVHDLKKHPLQFVFGRKGFFKKGFYGVTHYKALKERMQVISSFRKKYYEVDDSSFFGFDQLPEACSKYDLLCVGSDQLWNLNQKDNENRAYMLDFEHHCPAISYAISFGDGLQKKKEMIEASLPLVQAFRSVSVREQEGKDFLAEHGISSEVVLDPTLMVDPEFWNRFRTKKRIVKGKYILVYGFENASQKYADLIRAAKKMSEILDLPVVNPIMTPDLAYAGFKNYTKCGPLHFLNLVDNAEMVVTNSFHGTIFSALFGTPFISIKSDIGSMDPRKVNLLHMLNMEFRMYGPDERWDMNKLLSDEFDITDRLLSYRKMSLDYLSNAICKGLDPADE